ncbi:hypothetical protein AJ78_02153 [Emergomyces pasteurianus Ep9510]|uniref:2'-phosphotransferase n=1 Tax=Emergomyces pasteurianus Ep9510 TaxID=1447872 RepID=A0A1J9PMS8_9EURO|nr:hypothetical protein AJ78_02153 [Emergomyces pasteurianus Ep9510]
MSHPRRGRDRGRGEGRSEPSREVAVSKALSYILRHAAEREGVKIDSHGYANVADVLAWRKLKSLKVTLPEILNAVSTSDKQRFGLLYNPPHQTTSSSPPPPSTDSSGQDISATASTQTTAQALAANDPEPTHYLIRATQGHSIKTVEAASLLQKLSLSAESSDDASNPPLPDTVVHGTYHAAWPSILAYGGLRCMSRNHIHFATGPALSSVLPKGRGGPVAVMPPARGAGGVISGMRADAQILIYIDLKRALEAGVPFWRSENGVILSEGVDLGVSGVSGVEGEGEVSGRKGVGMEFFDVVVERTNGLGVLWDREQGGLVQETPDWMLKAKNLKGGAGRRGGGQRKGRGGGGAPRLRVEGPLEMIEANDI